MNQTPQQARNAMETELMTTAARLAELSAGIIDAVRNGQICELRRQRTIDTVTDWLAELDYRAIVLRDEREIFRDATHPRERLAAEDIELLDQLGS